MLGPLIAVSCWLLLSRTGTGRMIRAAAADREMLAALGADVGRLYTLMFMGGSFLAGLGGALVTPVRSIVPGMDVEIIVEAFIVVVRPHAVQRPDASKQTKQYGPLTTSISRRIMREDSRNWHILGHSVKLLEKTAPRKASAPAKDAEDLFHVTDWPMHYLLAIERHHVRKMSRVLAPYKCSPLVWRVLSILADRDGHSVSELAELSVIERSNLGRILEGMEREGLVERFDRETDKRQTAILLSPRGHKLFVESLPAVLRYYAHFLSGISPAETGILMNALRKIKRNVTTFDSTDVGGT